MTDHFPHIVVGGGISGLGAAHFATRLGVETLVIERSGRVGGTLNSHHFDACGDYWTEAGGHTCYNSYGNLLSILDDLGLTARITPKERVPFRLWRGGKRRPIWSAIHPFELMTSLPRLLRSSREGVHHVRLHPVCRRHGGDDLRLRRRAAAGIWPVPLAPGCSAGVCGESLVLVFIRVDVAAEGQAGPGGERARRHRSSAACHHDDVRVAVVRATLVAAH